MPSPLISATVQSMAREDVARRTAQSISGVAPASINSLATVLNDPHANGADSIRTGLQIIPSPQNAALALRSSESQIARLQSSSQQPTARVASEAYLTQAAARTQINLLPAQAVGSQGIDMMA
jgi:hypothetical protein